MYIVFTHTAYTVHILTQTNSPIDSLFVALSIPGQEASNLISARRPDRGTNHTFGDIQVYL